MNTANFRPAVAALAPGLGPMDLQTDYGPCATPIARRPGWRNIFLPSVPNSMTENAIAGRLEHCGDQAAAPACKVEVRFLYQVLRGSATAGRICAAGQRLRDWLLPIR